MRTLSFCRRHRTHALVVLSLSFNTAGEGHRLSECSSVIEAEGKEGQLKEYRPPDTLCCFTIRYVVER